jgi:hypothetical protein
MFSPIKFFQPAYLFDLRPFTYPQTIKIMAIFFVLMLIVGVVLKFGRKIKNTEKFEIKLLDKYSVLLISMAISGLIITWLKFERVHILAARFWLVIWAGVFVACLYPILKYQLKVVPEAKKHAKEKKLFQKYLPKKK